MCVTALRTGQYCDSSKSAGSRGAAPEENFALTVFSADIFSVTRAPQHYCRQQCPHVVQYALFPACAGACGAQLLFLSPLSSPSLPPLPLSLSLLLFFSLLPLLFPSLFLVAHCLDSRLRRVQVVNVIDTARGHTRNNPLGARRGRVAPRAPLPNLFPLPLSIPDPASPVWAPAAPNLLPFCRIPLLFALKTGLVSKIIARTATRIAR